jgi:hypothetical protein
MVYRIQYLLRHLYKHLPLSSSSFPQTYMYVLATLRKTTTTSHVWECPALKVPHVPNYVLLFVFLEHLKAYQHKTMCLGGVCGLCGLLHYVFGTRGVRLYKLSTLLTHSYSPYNQK